jgi:hypothetical protein
MSSDPSAPFRPFSPTASLELWQALQTQIGRGWSGERIEVHQAGWRLLLDSYRVPAESFEHTRMILAVPNRGFRFRIYEPHAFAWISTVFGLLDIEIGDEQFDARWVIKASSKSRIRELLADAPLRTKINAIQHGALSLEADQSRIDPERSQNESWDELVLVRAELQTSVDALRDMFDLLATTVERLEALASARASR